MDNASKPNIIETAIAAGKALTPRVIDNPITDGKPFVVLRDEKGGQRVQYLDERFEHPARKIGKTKLADAESFISLWKAHSSPRISSVYADKNRGAFTAIFDDHGPAPGHRQHRSELHLQPSRERSEWEKRNGKPFEGNVEFAYFIENNLPDFVDPPGGAMLEMAINFKVNESASFSNLVRLKDGTTQFNFTNESDAGSIKTPDQFNILIPVFDGIDQPVYRFDARFRYRLNGPKLHIWYELIRPHKVLERAFADVAEKIEDECETQIVFGAPE